jgi:Undecaprenyl-phosphate glucose phosphotransferase
MMRQREQFTRSVQYVADLAVVLASWLVAYPIRFKLIPLHVPHVPPFATYAWLGVMALFVWAVVLRVRPLYYGGAAESLQRRLWTGLRNDLLAFTTFVVVTVFVAAYKPSRIVLLIFLIVSAIGFVLGRVIIHRWQMARFIKGEGLTRVLIVGTGDVARALQQRIQAHPGAGHLVVGWLADDVAEVGRAIDGKPVLGAVEEVQDVVARHEINLVFVALPLEAHQRLKDVLNNLEDEMVDVKVVPDLLDFVVLQSSAEDFDGLPIISLKEAPLSGWGAVTKRVFDFVFSGTVLLLGSPVFLLIALAIKMTSRGPVFYRQERMGLDGRVFQLFKFRSMREDAEAQTGAVWARQDDPRRTRVGAFLRRTNLDELPQFYNVLRGEMSVVGPRPERPVFIEKFRCQIPKYMLRHKAKAGLTGWAQVNGWRGDSDLQRRIECDLFYVENWSFWFDLRIIWMTLFSPASKKNAY